MLNSNFFTLVLNLTLMYLMKIVTIYWFVYFPEKSGNGRSSLGENQNDWQCKTRLRK